MKIVVPTVDYPPIEGGISTVAREVSRELAAMGHAVTVVAPYFEGMSDFDAAEPVTVVRFKGYGLGWFRFFPLLWKTWPHVRGTDLLLAINVSYGGILGLLARRLRGIPYIAFAYAYEFLKFRHAPLLSSLLRRVYRRSVHTVAISRFTRDRLCEFGVPANSVSVILPGAPKPMASSPEELAMVRRRFTLDGARVILGVGRFVPRKGYRTLVKALPSILERHPDAVLVLVGQGPDINVVSKLAQKLEVRGHMVLPGRLTDEDVAALYQICEVFALPTGTAGRGQVEGFGLVFAEANAYGKPVVAGRSGGVVDAVADGETGILVSPEDPEAVAEAICTLLDDPEHAEDMGNRGRARVESELNWRVFTEKTMALLERGS